MMELYLKLKDFILTLIKSERLVGMNNYFYVIKGLDAKFDEEISTYLSYSYGLIPVDAYSFLNELKDKNTNALNKLIEFISRIYRNERILLKNISDIELVRYFKIKLKDNLVLINFDEMEKNKTRTFNVYKILDKKVTQSIVYNRKYAIKKNFEKIPLIYRNEIKRIHKAILTKMVNSVLFFMVSGSCARNSVNNGWSDIDLLIVLDNNTYKNRVQLKNIFSESPIKIGYTIYGKTQFESMDIDFKTAFAIYQMQLNEYYFPMILNEKLFIPYIDKYKLKILGKNQLPSMLHQISRIICDDKDKSLSDELLKKIIHAMRNILFIEDINPAGYKDVIEKYSELFSIEKFDVNKYICGKKNGCIYDYAVKFLDNINKIGS